MTPKGFIALIENMTIEDFDLFLSPSPGDLYMDTHFAEEKFELLKTLLRSRCCTVTEALDIIARLSCAGTRQEYEPQAQERENWREEFLKDIDRGEEWAETNQRRMAMLLARVKHRLG